jgi:hypothetical protein
MWPTQPPIKRVPGSFSDKIVGSRNWPFHLEPRLRWAKHYPYSPHTPSYYGRRQLSVIHFLPPPTSPSPYSCIFLVAPSRTVTGSFFCISPYHLATSAYSPAMKMQRYVPQQLRCNFKSRCGIMSWVGEIYFHTSLSWFSTIYSTTSLKRISLTSRL